MTINIGSPGSATAATVPHPPFLGQPLVQAVDSGAKVQGSGAYTDGTTILQQVTRSKHVFRRPGITVRLLFDNWSEWASAKTVDPIGVRVGVEEINGTDIQPVYFAGKRDVVIDPDGFVLSDPIEIPHLAGDTLWVRTQVSAGGVTPAGGAKIWRNWVLVTGEAREEGTTVTDKTLSGTVTASSGTYGYIPRAVVSEYNGTLPAVGSLGDSILATGYVLTALQNAGGVPHLDIAFSGEKLNDMVATAVGRRQYARRLMMAGCKHLVINYFRNDTNGGRTLAQIQADALTLLTWLASVGVKPYWCTSGPQATSTDSWATLANQTTTNESVRPAWNAWLRDGAPIDPTTKAAVAVGTGNALRAAVYNSSRTLVSNASGTHPLVAVFEVADLLESSRGSGKWPVDGTATKYTSDGLHPNAFGSAQAAGAIVTSLFT